MARKAVHGIMSELRRQIKSGNVDAGDVIGLARESAVRKLRGRPVIPDERRKTRNITFRMTEKDYERLVKRVGASGARSLSSLLQSLVRREIRKT